VGEGHVHTVGKGLGARFDGQVVCRTGLCVYVWLLNLSLHLRGARRRSEDHVGKEREYSRHVCNQ
jgi:hypothetical protein